MKSSASLTAEEIRLAEDRERTRNWKRWGPYLSERQWATVREDYSPHGNCWDYFPHDHARSRARLFLPNENGIRPVHGEDQRYATSPHWNDLALFYEYFHADTGRGCGASHQTGWTALAVRCLEIIKEQRGDTTNDRGQTLAKEQLEIAEVSA